MNVTRRQIRHALEKYEAQVRAIGTSSPLEMELYEALAGIVRGTRILDDEIVSSLNDRLRLLKAMIEELTLLEDADIESDLVTLEVDDVTRDENNDVTIIHGTRTWWQKVRSDRRKGTYTAIKHEPYIIGEV